MGNRRRGMTLLELIMATTLMTTMVATVAVVLRTGHAAWQAQQGEAAQIMAAHATVRHIVRRVRQAEAVDNISKATRIDGELKLLMPSGEKLVWKLDKGTEEARFGINSADNLLSRGITELRFIGYEADGVTQTDDKKEVHSIKCQVRVELPRETNSTRTVSCWAWLRAW